MPSLCGVRATRQSGCSRLAAIFACVPQSDAISVSRHRRRGWKVQSLRAASCSRALFTLPGATPGAALPQVLRIGDIYSAHWDAEQQIAIDQTKRFRRRPGKSS
jgi:hypothetical protein